MMAKLYCTVSEGLRSAEASITVTEYDGSPQHFPLDRGMITRAEGRDTIPVRILQRDERGELALVSLPVEADSGTQRIWVKVKDLISHKEAVG
jgi:hypothetical protein